MRGQILAWGRQHMSSPRTMRVLHVLAYDRLAGTERHVLQLVNNLRARGATAAVLCPRNASMLRSEAGRRGCPTCHLGDAVRMQPDVIHVHDGRSTLAGVALASVTGASLVRTQHFVLPATAHRRGWTYAASSCIHRMLNRRCRAYIAVSNAAALAATRRGEVRSSTLRVIYPGIDLPAAEALAVARYQRLHEPQPTILSAGRLEPERRFGLLLDAMPLIVQRMPTARLVIAGDGSAAKSLKRHAARLRVEDCVSWPGWVPDLGPLMARSSVYVNTLSWEGFGMATAQAMAYALPVVAAAGGANSELVENEKSGLLIPELTHVSLAAAICEVMSSPDTASALGSVGQAVAQSKFSASRTADLTVEVYENAMIRKRASHRG